MEHYYIARMKKCSKDKIENDKHKNLVILQMVFEEKLSFNGYFIGKTCFNVYIL